jgi:hypothetical protein
MPSKLKACSTNPTSVAVAPLCGVPWFVFTISFEFPSPGHQLTKPEGGGTQAGEACASWIAVRGAKSMAIESNEKVSRMEVNNLNPLDLILCSFLVGNEVWIVELSR